MKTNQPFAEVVESRLTHFTGQSWKWDNFAQFASLVTVKADNCTLYGVVHQIATGSLEPGRYPFTYQKTQEELLKEQPQIFEFLKTTFDCVVVGFCHHEKMTFQLPPKPAKIHAFIKPATQHEYVQFFSQPHFLHLLFSNTIIENIDEVILGLIRNGTQHKAVSSEKITGMIELYSLLIGNDYKRLKLLTSRL